jgi:TonB family protein
VRGDARIRIIHRTEAMVRAIYQSDQRWLVLLIDFADARTGTPDGIVDSTYSFQDVQGSWPLGARWQGSAVLDDYSTPSAPDTALGITADGAFVQLVSGSPAGNGWFAHSRAIPMFYSRSGRSNSVPGAPRATFDQAEERARADVTRSAQPRGSAVSSMTTAPPPGSQAQFSGDFPPPQAPVRVGGNIPTPRKITDARPVLSAAAAQTDVRGTVIVEIVIGADGAVSDAKILRSIPLFDQAALDAVRQWRYEPTQLNGRPVPVIMTVTVAFP